MNKSTIDLVSAILIGILAVGGLVVIVSMIRSLIKYNRLEKKWRKKYGDFNASLALREINPFY